jgi:hypothetical protein
MANNKGIGYRKISSVGQIVQICAGCGWNRQIQPRPTGLRYKIYLLNCEDFKTASPQNKGEKSSNLLFISFELH